MSPAADLPHVLVVDDNPDAAEVLALLICAEGFSTATARTVAQAREQIARQLPRMLFLDLHLPDGSGMDLLAELKADQLSAGIEVVLLSGLMEEALKEQAHLLGASAFLLKPLDHDRLTALLARAR